MLSLLLGDKSLWWQNSIATTPGLSERSSFVSVFGHNVSKCGYVCTFVTAYTMSYDNIEKWSYIDIAAVKVESPYDFTQTVPIPECANEKLTWAPNKININYVPKYQLPGTDALVLGWGHKSHWRQVGKT